jgi:predicted esterase
MKTMKRAKWRLLMAAGLTTTALLAGCGSDDDDPVATDPPAAAPQPAPPAAATTLKSATDAGAPLPVAQLDAALAGTTAAGLTGASRCDVQMVEIVYSTPAPDSLTASQASGVAMIPSGAACPGPHPLVAYSRGTDLDKARSLATPGDREATLVAAMLASQGYMVAATDYLGYAKSTWPDHPYLHADSEATANVDALRAARELAAQRGVALNGKVFVVGYSQGGHASMATQRLIETRLASEFALAGAAHLSGPYNLVGSIQESLGKLPLGELGSTYYIPFAVTSLQKVYKDLYTTPGQFFKAPYGETIEGLFPTTSAVTLQELIRQDKLPVLLSSLVTDDFVEAALNPASPLYRALVLNTTTNFAPRAQTLLCGGSRDPVVDFGNTTDAQQAFQTAGATSVRVYDVESEPSYAPLLRDDLIPVDLYTGYHASLVPPLCLLQARNLFQTL